MIRKRERKRGDGVNNNDLIVVVEGSFRETDEINNGVMYFHYYYTDSIKLTSY